mgnify:CR=1 FL=1
MKILHVIPSLSPDSGGPAQVAMNLVSSLRKLGVDAEIATTNHNSVGLLDVPTNERTEYVFDVANELSCPVWFLPYTNPSLKEFIFSMPLTGWLWKNLSSYDVIDNHYLFSYAPTCAAAIARAQKIPYTVRTMGQLTPWALSQSALKKKLYATVIERRNLSKASVIHCTSDQETVNVREFGISAPTETIPLGVNAPKKIEGARKKLRNNYDIPEEVPVFLFLSRIHCKKRPELLLKAAAEFLRKQPCHIIFAGTGETHYVESLQRLSEELEISNHVTFAGFVTGCSKDLLLQGADAFVLPSFSENFGIAVAEALISGLPVVLTPGIHISKEIKEADAGLVVDGEEGALCSALEKLTQHDRLRDNLIKNGLQLAQPRYSWASIAQNLSSVYESIASKE